MSSKTKLKINFIQFPGANMRLLGDFSINIGYLKAYGFITLISYPILKCM